MKALQFKCIADFFFQVPEKDKEAVRAAYLARHPNAFWVNLFIVLLCNLYLYLLLIIFALTTLKASDITTFSFFLLLLN